MASECQRLRILVQPRAPRSEVVGWQGDALKVRVTAAPVDDAANEMVVALLAEHFGVARRGVRVIAGRAGRRKTVEIRGLEAPIAPAVPAAGRVER